MKKLSIIISIVCACWMQAYAECGSFITPSEAASKALNGDKGTYCIEGYVVSTVDIYTNQYKNQSFMMADEPGGEGVFEAWRVVGVDYTIGIGSKVQVFDATLMVYQGIAETGSGFSVGIVDEVIPDLNLPEFGSYMSASEAAAYCLSLPYHDKNTEDMYVIEGYVSSLVTVDASDEEIVSLWLSDEKYGEAVFQAYECHATRNTLGDVMPIEYGDHVYVTGYLSRYDKKAQTKDGRVGTSAVSPFAVKASSSDPDHGTVTASGTTMFTVADFLTVDFTLTATPAAGYEFVAWIDPSFVNPGDGDMNTDLKVALMYTELYEKATTLSDDELEAYIVERHIDKEAFLQMLPFIEKMCRPSLHMDYEDLVQWIMLNDMDEVSVIRFEAVFRAQGQNEGVITPSGSPSRGEKVLRDGVLYLEYEGQMYDVRGAKAE